MNFKMLERIGRLAIPQIFLAVMVAFSLIEWPFIHAAMIKSSLVLMVIYYWAIFRPTLVPPVLCFLLGIGMDMVAGFPLGMMAIIFVATRWIVSDQRRLLMAQPYVALWAVFALVALAASLGQWILTGLVDLAWLPIGPVFLSVVGSLLVFPFVTLILIAIHRLLPGPTRVKA